MTRRELPLILCGAFAVKGSVSRMPEWQRMYHICEREEVSAPTEILLGPAAWADLERSVQSLCHHPMKPVQFRYRTALVEYDFFVPQRVKAVIVGPKPNSKASWVRVFYDIDEVMV